MEEIDRKGLVKEPGEGLDAFLSDLRERSKWLLERHNVQDALRLQRSADLLEEAFAALRSNGDGEKS